MIKSSNIALTKRVTTTYDRTVGIQKYDKDNSYPQRIKNIISNSGTASACVKLLAKFIKGDGFTDPIFWKLKVNQYQSLDKLFYKLAEDWSEMHGFAVLVGYNALCDQVTWEHIPFDFCRLGEADSQDFNGKIVVYNNWDKTNGKFDKNKFDVIDVYNPIKKIVQAQIDFAGDILKYKGQVLWVSAEGETYPKAPCDPVIEDIQTDAEIKNFRLRNVQTNFMAPVMVEYPYKFEGSEEREETEKWANLQGASNSGKIILSQNPDLNKGGQAIKISKLDTNDNDRLFQVTNQTAKDSIIQCYGQPPVLLGVAVAGKLGNADETRDAFEFYNNYTVNDRRVFEETFQMLFEKVKIDGKPANPSNIWTIGTLKFGEQTTLQRVGSNIGAITQLISSSVERSVKVNMLQILFGFSPTDAEKLVPLNVVQAIA